MESIINAGYLHYLNYGISNFDNDGIPLFPPVSYLENIEFDQLIVNQPIIVRSRCGYNNTLYRIRIESNHVYDIIINNGGIIIASKYVQY